MDFSSSVGRVGVLCVSTPVGTDKPPRGYKHLGRGIDVYASKRLEEAKICLDEYQVRNMGSALNPKKSRYLPHRLSVSAHAVYYLPNQRGTPVLLFHFS